MCFHFLLLNYVDICTDELKIGLVESLINLLLLLLGLFDLLGLVEPQKLVFMEFVVVCKALQLVDVDDAFI